MSLDIRDTDALLVVDPQVDFFPGGALPAPDGDGILPTVNRCFERFSERDLPIVVTRDWHPPNHCSFREQGGPWPVHCVQGTAGAELHPGLEPPLLFTMVHKATSPDREAYSDFEGTGLEDLLKGLGVERIVVTGLVVEYCIRAACLDGRKAGFEVVLLTDGTRAVDADDGRKVLDELRDAGVELLGGMPS